MRLSPSAVATLLAVTAHFVSGAPAKGGLEELLYERFPSATLRPFELVVQGGSVAKRQGRVPEDLIFHVVNPAGQARFFAKSSVHGSPAVGFYELATNSHAQIVTGGSLPINEVVRIAFSYMTVGEPLAIAIFEVNSPNRSGLSLRPFPGDTINSTSTGYRSILPCSNKWRAVEGFVRTSNDPAELRLVFEYGPHSPSDHMFLRDINVFLKAPWPQDHASASDNPHTAGVTNSAELPAGSLK